MSDENKNRANYSPDDMLDGLFEELGLNDFIKKYDALMTGGQAEDTQSEQPEEAEPARDDPFDALDKKTAEAKNAPSFTEAVISHAGLYFDSEADKEESFESAMRDPYAEPIKRAVPEEEPGSSEPEDEDNVPEPETETGADDDDSRFKIEIEDYDDFGDFGDFNIPPIDVTEPVGKPETSGSDLDDMFNFDGRDLESEFDIRPAAPREDSRPARKQSKKQSGVKAWFMSNVVPLKGDSTGEVVRKTLFVISVITIIVCLSILANIYIIEPHMANKRIIDMSNENSNTQTMLSVEAEKAKYPDVDFPEGIMASAVQWYAKNSDYAGWIKIPGAEIDCALTQAEDNNYYLKRDFYKQSTRYGCPFVSSSNNLRTLDRNTTIFGHNMENDDLLFGKLEQYLTVDGFKKAPVIEFSTPYAEYKCKIYAVFITNSKEKDDNGYCFYYFYDNLRTTKNFEDYIKNLDQRKLYSTGVDINADDKLLTLSTCSYDFDDARLVVVARLVRYGESAQVDTSKTEINPSPRYPQAWYDANGKNNPYKNAELWYKD